MERILACVDGSAYAAPVCDLAAWAAGRLDLPVELLHVVQRKDAAAERRDLSGAIGLGVKAELLEELTRIDEADARLQVERGRLLLAAARTRLETAGAGRVEAVHRHGGIVETILDREADAPVVVIGKRGASHAFASDHLGSKVERVVRASRKPILVASRVVEGPHAIVLAHDGSPAARRSLERCASSPLLRDLPVHLVSVGADDDARRAMLDAAASALGNARDVRTSVLPGQPEAAIRDVVRETPGALLVMGAYGHSPLRALIVGSTTTALIRAVQAPLLLIR